MEQMADVFPEHEYDGSIDNPADLAPPGTALEMDWSWLPEITQRDFDSLNDLKLVGQRNRLIREYRNRQPGADAGDAIVAISDQLTARKTGYGVATFEEMERFDDGEYQEPLPIDLQMRLENAWDEYRRRPEQTDATLAESIHAMVIDTQTRREVAAKAEANQRIEDELQLSILAKLQRDPITRIRMELYARSLSIENVGSPKFSDVRDTRPREYAHNETDGDHKALAACVNRLVDAEPALKPFRLDLFPRTFAQSRNLKFRANGWRTYFEEIYYPDFAAKSFLKKLMG